MCGIAGIVGHGERGRAAEACAAMVGALARRGPDGEGMEAWDSAVLGHRRLAIFDLSEAGRQPMLSEDGRVGVVFNGAIYNWRALRSELEREGHRFRSRTDTEVLVEGYRAWGVDRLVARLRGMFAFGLWDDAARKLFLVRDRLGVKPLVYAEVGAEAGRGLAFASTARALRRGGFVGRLDPAAVAEFLHFGFVTDARSIYEGARKVPAATIVEWSEREGAREREYWSPPATGESDDGRRAPDFAEAVEETERLFLRAVEARLDADVPVGALLSGGVDSSLVCWAVRQLGGDVTAYTVGTPNDPLDETEDARATAAALGIRHRVLDLSAADEPGAEEVAAAYAEPFACASALGMLRVSERVASEATVLLTGDGGDDVFLGYPEHRHLWLASRLARSLPAPAGRAWRAARTLVPRRGALKRAASFLDYATGGLAAVAANRDGLPLLVARGVLGPRLSSFTAGPLPAAPADPTSPRRVLSDFLAYDRRTRFVGEYLPKVDGGTMYHGLEARSPFLDQELWEFAAGLPFGVRLRGGQLKAVLRELARRRVGERVASGRKRGFGVPVGRWMAGRWRGAVEEALSGSLLGAEGWVDAGRARALLAESVPEGSAPLQLWYVYVLESWLRHERAEVARGTARLTTDGAAGGALGGRAA
ncbi:MAG TPA: asparagine synthase (glutamine-hydrolyzing) [Pyrinomonadaceae bacterium]|nr:asparagine synthase (glutamine-hydrolyzing) [Pyrinomonadaceae bacterium]